LICVYHALNRYIELNFSTNRAQGYFKSITGILIGQTYQSRRSGTIHIKSFILASPLYNQQNGLVVLNKHVSAKSKMCVNEARYSLENEPVQRNAALWLGEKCANDWLL